jgi:hypothetical protein
MTEVRISETAEKTFAIAEKTLVIVERIGVTVEKIIRIAGGIGVPLKGISRATGDTGLTTEENSGVTGDSDEITKGISERIVEFVGTPNDIIPQGQIAGTDTFLNVTDMHIPADLTEEEAGAKFTVVRFFPV